LVVLILFCLTLASCRSKPFPSDNPIPLAPRAVTDQVVDDSDDPAIWLHPTDRSQSLILGTDKGDPGALYVFGLDGRVIPNKVVYGLHRPNNVDVEYGLMLSGAPADIAVVTQNRSTKIRVYSLPDMREIDAGGLEIFSGVANVEPMGVALYRRPSDGAVFAIFSRKEGPTDSTYLWQYRLEDEGTGLVQATKVREFGAWCGKGEIEAIAVDDALGYVYYSDEWHGVRKYAADPSAAEAQRELAVFGTAGFKEDREGISIYPVNDGTGYIIVSDQQADTFHFFKREGELGDPHHHALVRVLKLSTDGSDGSEVTNAALSEVFPAGLFVAMSEDRVFQLYSWPDLAGDELVIAPNGEPSSRAGSRGMTP
jgi:3-phytase